MNSKAIRKQLLAAVAMVLVATVALGSSTYAWFAINSKVTATGMNFTTKVQDNLFIASATHSDTNIKPEANFRTTEVQAVTGVLEPVSTNDGMSFWYAKTNNVNGDGQVKNNEWINYSKDGLASVAKPTPATGNYTNNAFSLNYIPDDTTAAVGFVDYVYNLKAVAGNDTTLNLTKLDLTYADQQANAVNSAFRVAVFIQEATGSGENSGTNYTVDAATDNSTVKSDGKAAVGGTAWIFAPKDKGTNNFTTNGTTNAVVIGADAVQTMTYKNDNATLVVTTGTHYYKVVVRVWLEGQDQNCNNTTFAKLDDGKWALNTEWTLGNATGTPVTAINVAESKKTDTDLSAATKTATTTIINGVTYAELSVSGYWVDNSAAFTNSSRVYTIEEGQITEVTHLVTLPAPSGG